jgi:flagellar motor switch protein FliG
MMRAKDDYRSLNGLQKAALLVMSVGEDTAAKIFQLMHDDEIREISQTMANLGTVNATVIERLFVEFADQISSTGTMTGTYESTERLLMKVLDRGKVDTIMEEIRGPAGRTMWDKLGNVHESVLANFLKNEYPQTVAVVLSKVKPDHGARVLSMLPEAFAMEVIMRMLRMESVQKDILDDVERVLRNEFMSNLARTSRRDAHEMIAEIFNNLDRASESRFLTALEERNRDSAEKVRSLMFTFEDLGKLDPGGVQTLLRNVEKDKLPLCLKGASEALRDLFLSNMSERASKMLKEDMAAMGPVRLRDVEEAQLAMVTVAKELAGKGEIMLSDKKGEDELIY